jgi:hypothetical protein
MMQLCIMPNRIMNPFRFGWLVAEIPDRRFAAWKDCAKVAQKNCENAKD